MPIHISNISFYDVAAKKGVRIGYKFNEKKIKQRFKKNDGKIIK